MILERTHWFLLLLLLYGISLHGTCCFQVLLPLHKHHHQRRTTSTTFSVSTKATHDVSTKEVFESFEQKLLYYLNRNDTTPIIVEGWVTSKRSLGKQLCFADFQIPSDVDYGYDSSDGGDICQAMIRKEYFTGENYIGYRRCLLIGAKLRLVGIASPTRNPGNVVLLIKSITLLSVPRQIQHIQIILNQCMNKAIPLEEVAKACNWEPNTLQQRLQDISNDNNSSTASTSKQLKELAKQIFESLPEDPTYPDSVDQKTISKSGNFIVPKAPNDWRKVPEHVLGKQKHQDVIIMPKESVHDALSSAGTQEEEEQQHVSVAGWVQNRRRFDNNITMLSLVDDLTLLSQDHSDPTNVATERLACLIHPELLKDDAGMYRNLMAVGAKVQVVGVLCHDREIGKSILWVNQIRLLRCSSRSVTIRHLLDLMKENKMDLEETADALLITYNEAMHIATSSDATERRWKANELAVSLQQASYSMRDVVSPKLLQTMERYKFIANKHPVVPTDIALEDTSISNNSLNNTKIMPMGMPGSKWLSKKKPQLQWMGHQIQSVLRSHPDFGKRKLSILDIGGGKGSLANYLGQAVNDVQVHVVDICEGAVANGVARAKRLNAPVEFQIADASSSDLDCVQADLVVALHACGHLSDVALAHAVKRRAGFVIVPCCFNSNPHLQIRDVEVHDWLGLPKEDWSSLKLLAEVQGDIVLANEATAILCAIRAEAARKKLLSLNDSTVNSPDIKIRRFPIHYSTRNTVLVGKCSQL